MKIKTSLFTISLLLLAACAVLVGCGGGGVTKPDFNADISAVLPEDVTLEHFTPEENVTYYTSPGLSLMAEVNGAFLEIDYFSVEGSRRVYGDLYLYEDDYLYMITSDYRDIYASLSDPADAEYAEEEREEGYDIQLNIKRSGIYRLIFDTESLKFDLEYKAEIDKPRYYTIKNCQIFSVKTNWVDMTESPDNPDEFVIRDYYVGKGEYISFHDRTHTSSYKTCLAEASDEKYASYRYPTTVMNVGGRYNIYINRKTYEVRMELLNPDTAEYSCVYYDGAEFIELKPSDADAPYIFRQRIEVGTKNTTSLPDFHTSEYKTYALKVLDPDGLMTSSTEYHYFKTPGNYELTVNLKTFEITVELLPE